MINKLVEIKKLKTYFERDLGTVKAVNNVSFVINEGETIGLVGESGCGKSITALSILQLVPWPGEIKAGEILYFDKKNKNNIDLASLNPKGERIRSVRGKDISIIFQEPMTSLSPVHTIGNQICESILLHEQEITKKQARERAISLMQEVGLPRPQELIDNYTFELSGGMRQRVMIAMALSCYPRFLIADEPTTALDVTVQAQILELINRLKEEIQMSVLNITHDLGVIAEMAEKVIVMYLGKIVEKAEVHELFNNPLHPYTRALLKSIPSGDVKAKEELAEIKGKIPEPYSRPNGCLFGPRCDCFMSECKRSRPPLLEVENDHMVRCFQYSKGVQSVG